MPSGFSRFLQEYLLKKRSEKGFLCYLCNPGGLDFHIAFFELDTIAKNAVSNMFISSKIIKKHFINTLLTSSYQLCKVGN